jgi:predicted phosphodiesterase
MTYALISDIHGNIAALQAVLNDARKNNVQNFIFLGDYCVGLPYPNEVIDCIRSLKSTHVIFGNEEDGLIYLNEIDPQSWPTGQYEAAPWYYENLTSENKEYIFSLPSEITLETESVPIFLFHKPEEHFLNSTPSKISAQYYAACIDKGIFTNQSFKAHCDELLEQDSLLSEQLSTLKDGVYVFGHKHIQWCKEIEGKLLVNPGSCGVSLDFQTDAAYAILKLNSGTWECELRRIEYDVSATFEEMKKTKCAKELPIWFGIISKEMLTAREQAIPFLAFTEEYANKIGDSVRPFTKDTWYASYELWASRKT